MIELLFQVIGEWLLSGSNKGWSGLARVFIITTLVLGLAGVGIYIYITNLADMGTVEAVVIGSAIVAAYCGALFAFVYFSPLRHDRKGQTKRKPKSKRKRSPAEND